MLTVVEGTSVITGHKDTSVIKVLTYHVMIYTQYLTSGFNIC